MLGSHMETVMMNLGPVATTWLKAVGIETIEDLKGVGIEEAFGRMVAHGFNVNAVMLYAMEGAVMEKDWNKIDNKRRAELQKIAQSIKFKMRKG
jgi:DNA transformation protein